MPVKHDPRTDGLLKDAAVRAEYGRLNRDELVMLDVIAEERAKDRLHSLSKARMVELDDL